MRSPVAQASPIERIDGGVPKILQWLDRRTMQGELLVL